MGRIEVRHSVSLGLLPHYRSKSLFDVSNLASALNSNCEVMVSKELLRISPSNIHALGNPGFANFVLIELQRVIYLGEDDIDPFRYVYGRA